MAGFIIAVFTGGVGNDSLEGDLVEDGADYEDGLDRTPPAWSRGGSGSR
ncbi:hypothetical protein [Paenarthrobacter nicotinovorans]|nr:hypothetical protein [Paenarthrobacter nicotinovorans]